MMSNRAYVAVSIKNERVLDKSFAKIAPSFEVKKEDMELILNANSREEKADCTKNFDAVEERLNMTSLPYALYAYRKEIKRRRLHIARLSQAKINLTNDLIVKSAGDIHTALDNGINNINLRNNMSALTRELMYVNKLQRRMKRTEIVLKKKEQARKAAKKSTAVKG